MKQELQSLAFPRWTLGTRKFTKVPAQRQVYGKISCNPFCTNKLRFNVKIEDTQAAICHNLFRLNLALSSQFHFIDCSRELDLSNACKRGWRRNRKIKMAQTVVPVRIPIRSACQSFHSAERPTRSCVSSSKPANKVNTTMASRTEVRFQRLVTSNCELTINESIV